MITLALDASTYVGSVALLDGDRVIGEATVAMKGVHEERLMPAVAQLLEAAGFAAGRVQRVVCGAGPGSFTSLRIAGGIAKGIATGVGCAFFAVPSLALVVASSASRPARYTAVLDALRGECYVGLYEITAGGSVQELAPAMIISAADAPAYAARAEASLIGPGHGGRTPQARDVRLLEELMTARGPADAASWEPEYGRLAEAQVRWEAAHGRRLADA